MTKTVCICIDLTKNAYASVIARYLKFSRSRYIYKCFSMIGNGLIETSELDSFLNDLCEELGDEVREYEYI